MFSTEKYFPLKYETIYEQNMVIDINCLLVSK